MLTPYENFTLTKHTLLFCCLTLLTEDNLPKLFCFLLFVPQVTVLFLTPVDTLPLLPLATIAETRSLDTDITNSTTILQLFTFLSCCQQLLYHFIPHQITYQKHKGFMASIRHKTYLNTYPFWRTVVIFVPLWNC